MPWTIHDFPAVFKNFDPEVRDKMIEIANALVMDEDYDESKAIPIAISKAKEWAKNRGIRIEEDDE